MTVEKYKNQENFLSNLKKNQNNSENSYLMVGKVQKKLFFTQKTKNHIHHYARVT
jgi:hypothetical protein